MRSSDGRDPTQWAQIVSDELGLQLVQHSMDLSDLSGGGETQAALVRAACDRYQLRIDSVFTGLVAYSTSLMLGPDPAERDRAEVYWSDMIRFAAQLGARSAGDTSAACLDPTPTTPTGATPCGPSCSIACWG